MLLLYLLTYSILFITSYSLSESKKCHYEDFRYGQWVQNIEKCGLVQVYDHPLLEPFVHLDQEKYPWSDYCWEPFNCIADSFSLNNFCSKLNGRSILTIGDSLQHQLYDALYMLLETPGTPPNQWSEIYNIETHGRICSDKGNGRLVFIRNDQLTTSNTIPLSQHVVKRISIAREWASIADLFDIIVINKGAHFIPSEDEFRHDTIATAKRLRAIVEKRLLENKITEIIFRTTPQGHPNCSRDSKPDLQMLTRRADSTLSKTGIDLSKYYDYHWDSLYERDEIAIAILKDELGPYLKILHAAQMTSLRPDGHRCQNSIVECDELHYFLPSVVDSWVHVLYNIMSEP